MSSSSPDVIYSTKNYRSNWLSQFGLYRYESTTSPRRVEHDKRNKLLLIRAFCVLSVLVALAIIIFSIVDYITNWNDETDRIIFLSKNNPKISNEQHQSNHRMTTVYYPDEQISSYHSTQSIITTTPMNSNLNSNSSPNQTKNETPIALKSTALPPNHKRYYSQVLQNRNDIETDPIQKTQFHKSSETELKSRMFFQNDDDTDDIHDYFDVQKVNSIQDILDEGNDYDHDHEFNDIISSSMPFSRGMKIEGTYRREMKKRDFINSIEALNSENIPLRDEQNIKHSNDPNDLNDDPFSKYKPKSPDEVNSLAAANQQHSSKYPSNFYAVHKPRPLTIATTYNPYMNDYIDSQDPHFIYHQVIAASSNLNRDIAPKASSRFEKATFKKQKPFSLMLDVYPMNDDDRKPTSLISATRNSFYKRPYYPVNMNAINHNLQHANYNQMKFPQLQQYRAPYGAATNQNDAYFRKYMMNRMGPQQFYPTTLAKQSTFLPSDLVDTNAPSQITVHLNLYPNRKKLQARNVEIIDIGETIDNNNPNVEAIKRSENNFSDLNIQETQSHGQFYIPPFSAIKMNSLQPQLNATAAQPVSDANSNDQITNYLLKAEPTTFSRNNDNEFDEDIKTTSITETMSNIIRFPDQ